MVKRKATTSLDAWLRESELASAARRVQPEIATEEASTTSTPTAAESTPQMTLETPTVEAAEVEVTRDDAARWFWDLLEQSGYELW